MQRWDLLQTREQVFLEGVPPIIQTLLSHYSSQDGCGVQKWSTSQPSSCDLSIHNTEEWKKPMCCALTCYVTWHWLTSWCNHGYMQYSSSRGERAEQVCLQKWLIGWARLRWRDAITESHRYDWKASATLLVLGCGIFWFGTNGRLYNRKHRDRIHSVQKN